MSAPQAVPAPIQIPMSQAQTEPEIRTQTPPPSPALVSITTPTPTSPFIYWNNPFVPRPSLYGYNMASSLHAYYPPIIPFADCTFTTLEEAKVELSQKLDANPSRTLFLILSNIEKICGCKSSMSARHIWDNHILKKNPWLRMYVQTAEGMNERGKGPMAMAIDPMIWLILSIPDKHINHGAMLRQRLQQVVAHQPVQQTQIPVNPFLAEDEEEEVMSQGTLHISPQKLATAQSMMALAVPQRQVPVMMVPLAIPSTIPIVGAIPAPLSLQTSASLKRKRSAANEEPSKRQRVKWISACDISQAGEQNDMS